MGSCEGLFQLMTSFSLPGTRRGLVFRLAALYRGWEEPLASEPTGVHLHADRRPLVGRKLQRKSVEELRMLGLTVDDKAPTA